MHIIDKPIKLIMYNINLLVVIMYFREGYYGFKKFNGKYLFISFIIIVLCLFLKLICNVLLLLIVTRKIFKVKNRNIYNKVLTKSWLLGILSDLLTLVILVFFEKFNFLKIESIAFVLIGIVISFILTLIFNYFYVFRSLDLFKKKRLIASIVLGALTVSYYVWIPLGLIFA